MRRPRPKFKVSFKSFYLYFCCFWINVTQINFENIKRKIQRIISDSCFQLKLWFNVNARAPSIPLLNFPFKQNPWENVCIFSIIYQNYTLDWLTFCLCLPCSPIGISVNLPHSPICTVIHMPIDSFILLNEVITIIFDSHCVHSF